MDLPLPVRYFSYGSNLSRANFLSRHRDFGGNSISFTRARACTLPGWTLTFNGFFCPPVEPTMASIERSPSGVVDGILYEIGDARAWAGVVQSEGGDGAFYDVVRVCVRLEAGERLEAATLVVTRLYDLPRSLRAHVRPSARYVGLIRAGAEEEGMARLVETLKGVRTARRESVAMQTCGLLGSAWLIRVSSGWLRFTMWPHTRVGARLYYEKERLLAETAVGAGGALKKAMYYCAEGACTLLACVYAVGGLCVIAASGEARRMFVAMFKRMVKR